jgi:hypothetical protein
MKIDDAKAKGVQIFEEERRYPTVGYSPIPRPPKTPANDATEIRQLLSYERAKSLLIQNRTEARRQVLNGEDRFQFESRNYNLLVALLGRTDEPDRAEFLRSIANRVDLFPASAANNTYHFLSRDNQTSELPLVAEFLIRNGARTQFFDAMGQCQPSPGVAIMLLGLSDLIALNYPIFSEAEYATLSANVSKLWQTTYDAFQYIRTYGYNLKAAHWSQFGINGSTVCTDILERCRALIELCRKANFLYLENALTENINLEVNQDKYVVEGFLEKFGFTGPLLTALNEAERLNSASATESDLKSSLGHLRSFLEHLHGEAIPRIRKKKKINPPADSKWGTQLTYLRVHTFLTEQEEKFVAGLFAVISDEAIHPLIARREYARLARNVVIEYALLFLRKLEKLAP